MSLRGRLLLALDRYFEVTCRGSSFSTEVRAGCVTFLTMSYILPVNAHILTDWTVGAPGDLNAVYKADIATATSLACAFGCALVGILSGMPFAVGPGMGLNTLVASLYVQMCQGPSCDISQAEEAFRLGNTTVLLLGVIILVLSLANACQLLLLLLPTTLKQAIMVGIGVYQAFIGFRMMKIIQPAGNDLLKLEGVGADGLDFDPSLREEQSSGWAQLLFFCCLVGMSSLYRYEVKGSILIAILLATCLSWIFVIGGGEPVVPFALPSLQRTPLQLDIGHWLDGDSLKYPSQLMTMFLITVFDVGGMLFGIAQAIDLPSAKARGKLESQESQVENWDRAKKLEELAQLESDIKRLRDQAAQAVNEDQVETVLETMKRVKSLKEKHAAMLQEPLLSYQAPSPQEGEILPGRAGQMAFACVGATSIVSALLGCSPCIIFLECCAGVKEGAKTGLASVVTGGLFLLSIFFAPLFEHVPMFASAAALVHVGSLMMSQVDKIRWSDQNHALPAFLCILMMPFTASITPGIVFGMVTYLLMALGSPRELMRQFVSSGDLSTPVSIMNTPEPSSLGYKPLSPYESPLPTPGGSAINTPGESDLLSRGGGERRRSVARLARKENGHIGLVPVEILCDDDDLGLKSDKDAIFRPTSRAPTQDSVVPSIMIGSTR